MLPWTLLVAVAMAQSPADEGDPAESITTPAPEADPAADPDDVAPEDVGLVPTDALDAPPWSHQPPLAPTLVDAGSRPMRMLRFRPQPGDRWQMQVSREHTVVWGEERAPGVSSVLSATVRVDDGRVSVEPFDLDLLGAPTPALVKAREAARTLGRQAPPSGALDDRQLARLDADPTALDPLEAELLSDLVWTLQSTALPLPDGRVGPGARWTWTVESAEGTVQIEQVWTATLVQADRRELEVDLRLDATTGGGLEDASLHAEGRVWQRLDRPLPRAADLLLTATMAPESSPDAPPVDDPAPPTPPASMEARITVVTRDVPAPGPADG